MKKPLPFCLFLLRVTIFIVMLMWTLDKFIRPAHAASVFAGFYLIPAIPTLVMYIVGALEMILIVAFLLGLKKNLTYGLVFIFHAISTLSCYQQYATPYQGNHLLFFAALPMLAACLTLYLMRHQDKILTFG